MSDYYRIMRPENGESLLGYFRRIGDLNGYAQSSDFLTALGYRYGRNLVENVEALEVKLKLANSELCAISPLAAPSTPVLDWRFERHHRDPICPSCMAEGRSRRQSWRSALVAACEHHEILLQDTCPRCTSPLKPNNGGFRTCECGLSLAEFQIENAPDRAIIIASLVANDPLKMAVPLPAAWTTAAPPDLCRFLTFLAADTRRSRTGKSGKYSIPQTVQETLEFMDPVGGMLSDWPKGFDQHVTERFSAGDLTANSIPGRLGRWYQTIMGFKGDDYAEFRRRIMVIGADAFDGAYASQLTNTGIEREWVSATEAAKMIGVRAERLVEAVANGTIEGVQRLSGSGHRHTQVRRTVVQEVVSSRERFVTALAAAKILGVSRKQFNMIGEAGAITPVDTSNRPPLVEGGFDSEALIAMVDRFKDTALDQTGDTLSFSDINLRRTTDRNAILQVIRLIFSGGLLPVSTEGKLGEFQFLKADLEATLAANGHSSAWSAHDIAKMTGWKHEVVVHWCKVGLLKVTQPYHGKRGQQSVLPEDLVHFQSCYIPVADFAKQGGTTGRHMLNHLRKSGIPTVGAKNEGNTSRGHLLRVSDLAQIAPLSSTMKKQVHRKLNHLPDVL